jgi:hypothetical protein
MLPFDKRPWAKTLAASVITVALIAAICVPIILHHFKALDPPIIVGIVLLLLAIIPPNLVVLRRHHKQEQVSEPQRSRQYATPPASR